MSLKSSDPIFIFKVMKLMPEIKVNHKVYSNMQPPLRYTCISFNLILVSPESLDLTAHCVLMVMILGLP